MKMDLVQKHEAMLFEIETCVIDLYRQHRGLVDANVDLVYETLQRSYKAEAANRPVPTTKMSSLEQELFDNLKSIYASWMSAAPAPRNFFWQKPLKPGSLKTVQDIQESLKVLRSSVKLWNKSFGRTGYLDYIEEFLPE